MPATHGSGGLENDAAAKEARGAKTGVADPAPAPQSAAGSEPLCNLPPTLDGRQGEKNRIRHPKSALAARCTSKCVSTCVLGGYGAPGVGGPFNVRSLVECSDICNLIKDGEDDQ